MARIRSVHPGLWTDEDFVQLSPFARLMCIGLWNEADDYGVFEWKPLRLKMRIFPADNLDASSILDELEKSGMIIRIMRGEKGYGLVNNFRKFQRPKTPSAPIIPIDDDIKRIIGLPLDDEISPALPQPFPSPSEKPLLMEDGGDKMKEIEEETVGAPVGAKKNPRGCRLPDEWNPNFKDWQTAVEKLSQAGAREELEKYRDYWKAKAGKDAARLDWDATWRNWVRNSKPAPGQRGIPKKSAVSDVFDRIGRGENVLKS